jgi:hypothetical protein
MGFANTLDMPARQSYVIELVGKQDLISGIALNSAIVNLAKIIGPALAGIVITLLVRQPVFLLTDSVLLPYLSDCFLFIPSIFLPAKDVRILDDVREGIRYIAANKILLSTIFAMAAIGTFAMNSDVLIPVFAGEVLHMQSAAIVLC